MYSTLYTYMIHSIKVDIYIHYYFYRDLDTQLSLL